MCRTGRRLIAGQFQMLALMCSRPCFPATISRPFRPGLQSDQSSAASPLYFDSVTSSFEEVLTRSTQSATSPLESRQCITLLTRMLPTALHAVCGMSKTLTIVFGRPYWRQLDREPPRNGPAGIENDQVQCERRKRVGSGIGDDEIGPATAALLLKFVELEADRFWRAQPNPEASSSRAREQRSGSRWWRTSAYIGQIRAWRVARSVPRSSTVTMCTASRATSGVLLLLP